MQRLDSDASIRAASLAGALSDPTRLSVAATLLEADELCVCDLSWIVEKPQALVSHHARLLRDRGLLRSRRDGKMVLYSLTDAARELLESVLGLAAGSPARV
jgi:DNA-binding transcriptional ArsR family regulator